MRPASAPSAPAMKEKLIRPNADDDARIARGAAADPDAAPDLSATVAGIIQARVGRPPKPNRKVSVALRLDREAVRAIRRPGAGWQTRINAALRRSKTS